MRGGAPRPNGRYIFLGVRENRGRPRDMRSPVCTRQGRTEFSLRPAYFDVWRLWHLQKNKCIFNMNSGFGKCKFPCRPTQLFAFRNSRSVSALFSQVSSITFGPKVEKGIDLSAQDKRFLNAIFAMQKSMFSHWKTQHSAFRKRCKIRCSMLHSAQSLLGQKSKRELT